MDDRRVGCYTGDVIESERPPVRGYFYTDDHLPKNIVSHRQELRALDSRKYRDWTVPVMSMPDIAEQYDVEGSRRGPKNPGPTYLGVAP